MFNLSLARTQLVTLRTANDAWISQYGVKEKNTITSKPMLIICDLRNYKL